MTRIAAMLSVIGVLVIGILIGALGTHLYFIDEIRRPKTPPRFQPDAFIERLTDELDLSREQLIAIREIGRETRERADALHREMLPRVRAEMDAARAAMEALLTDEQRERFERMRHVERQRIEQFWLGTGDRRGAGRPGPGGRPHNRPRPPID